MATDPLKWLEIPEPGSCGCPWKPEKCDCVGPCECPLIVPPPCCHVLAADHKVPFGEWLAMLADSPIAPGHIDSYVDPPTPANPMFVMDRADRVRIMARRRREGDHLRHPDDLNAEDFKRAGARVAKLKDGFGHRAHRGGNGILQLGRMIFDRDSEEEDDGREAA